ncbi:hypothetical protein [Candidatus Mycobacterium methanotrophicum]|uniref:Uncharacterized protein n=1 Tax=Candidatus Mycobacterium methanotrophicum TaxID=2943498 RepID=A0ABY4QQN3_9MYCO|nr:hypothetical protein [Candidatus Mycobacterium methanotrophicum]UQX12271.1 hypothetical protein M5I08_08350 [Candidatus Mycobacterium methanotrophicum]
MCNGFRAVGIASNIIVGVEVLDGEKGHPDVPVGTRAIDLAELMLRKANAGVNRGAHR